MKAYKGFLAVILVMAMFLSMGVMGVSATDADKKDTSSPKAQLTEYIRKDLYKDMCTTGVYWRELIDNKAAELGVSAAEAFEAGIDTGVYRYYTKDELPVPTSTATQTETTEETSQTTESTTAATEPAETTVVTDPAESTPAATETTVTTASTDPTESVALPENSTTAVTEPSENVTLPSETVTEPSENVTEPVTNVPSATEDQETGTNRYYFYMPEIWSDSEYTLGAGIYWWEGTDACSSWPGREAKKADAPGVYYYDIPKDVTSIIWNNLAVGGIDTPAEVHENDLQTININCEYYEAGDSDTYPDGLESFDDMIYVVHLLTSVSEFSPKRAYEGEWYYYYGNGEYGITPEKGDKVYTDSYLEEPIVPESPYEMGDVNLDGKLNIKDATAIQKYVAKINTFAKDQIFLADFNQDGIVNIKDATTIQKKIAGLI